MAIKHVVTRGYGNGTYEGAIGFVATRGYTLPSAWNPITDPGTTYAAATDPGTTYSPNTDPGSTYSPNTDPGSDWIANTDPGTDWTE